MEFKERTAIVTGAGGGIGLAICTALAAEGAAVVVNDVAEGAASRTAEAVEAAGGRALVNTADISDPDAAADLAKAATEAFGGIDVLVNNAGITRDMFVMKMSVEDWRKVLGVNLDGAFHCTRAVLRPMMKQARKGRPGSVVNIASVIGIGGNAGQANYAASKGGLIAFTKSLAKELGPRKIRVNAVAPGFIVTAMTDALSEDVQRQILERIPLGELGRATDVAQAVCFLASDRARYVTGTVLRVDGGLPV